MLAKTNVKEKNCQITDNTGCLKLYDIPKSPLKIFTIKLPYCSMTGRFKSNSPAIFIFNSGLNSGDKYFWVGSPGDSRTITNKKLISKKSVTRELIILLSNAFRKDLFINSFYSTDHSQQ